MRACGRFLIVVILGSALGCGSGGSDNGGGKLSPTGRDPANGGQCPGSTTGQTCTGEEAYGNCLTTACGSQFKACFGSSYTKGDFAGGACSDYITCEMACPCDATANTCLSACSQYMMAGTCASCMTSLTTCISAAGCTMPVCTSTSTGTTTSTGTGLGTGANCAALQTCCASITNASIATACNASKTDGSEQICGLVLQGFQQGGYCK